MKKWSEAIRLSHRVWRAAVVGYWPLICIPFGFVSHSYAARSANRDMEKEFPDWDRMRHGHRDFLRR